MNGVMIFLVILALVSGISVLWIQDVLSAVLISGLISLIASILFLLMAAPDVAITEAAIGAALTLVIFVLALSRTKKSSKE